MPAVLILTSEFYGSANRIGSHEIANKLARLGYITYIVSFPITPLYRFFPKKTQYGDRSAFNCKFKQVDKNLYSYIPEVLIPPLPTLVKKLPCYLNLWEGTCSTLKEQLSNKHFDFVFCESLFFPNSINNISYEKLIVRLPDNLAGFWKDNTVLHSAEHLLLKKADLIVSPSNKKLEDLAKVFSKEKLFYLPNGVNYDDYQVATSRPLIYDDYEHNAVYVGAIQKWFDFETLEQVAKQKENWQFTVIGNSQRKSRLPNIKFVGEKTGKEKIRYLQHADVGLIPFETKRNKALIDYVNPIKLFEYLAAGIPVISSSWSEILRIDAPITPANNVAEWIDALSELEASSQNQIQLKSFAKNFSWDAITQLLLDNIRDEKKN